MNLLQQLPTGVDPHELRLLLDMRIGGPGQYDGEPKTKFYLPLARADCRIILTYDGNQIVAIEPGPAFDASQWSALVEELKTSILAGPTKIGRDYSFSSFRVVGFWRGHQCGVQILPPSETAPRAPVEIAQHPFILEFPLQETRELRITNYRRIREHRSLSLLLNVLLAARVSIPPRQHEHFWVSVPPPAPRWNFDRLRKLLRLRPKVPAPWQIIWAQEFFFAELGPALRDELSSASIAEMEKIPATEYYERVGHDGRGLRIPSDLDDSIMRYQHLSQGHRARFNRALFWMDLASRHWNTSMSSSFASLVSAVESMTERGSTHWVYCSRCNEKRQHEVPGATERFRAFFEAYAPGLSLQARRTEMYRLRSGILHGSKLMEFDEGRALGWDPPWWNERALHDELWSLTGLALRNWLKSPANE